MDDQGRRRDRRQASCHALAFRQDVVVLDSREVAGALDVAAHEASHRRLGERTLPSREHAGVVDEVLDDRLGV